MNPSRDDPLVLGEAVLGSRLLVGTGKYASFEQMEEALEASGTQCVTVAVRRVNLGDKTGPSLLDHVDRSRYTILPNTAGCFEAKTAIRTAVLAREILGTKLVKLEVLGDQKTLLPDPVGTLEAAKELVAQGFDVLVYTSDDPRLGVRLAELGVRSVMPAGSPIGSGQGVLNTGIAGAREPVRMAGAMRDACSAGRQAFLAGRIPRRLYANASSPVEGVIGAGVIGSATGA